jgi:hypothetical protein
MTPYFAAGKLHKPVRLEAPDSTIGEAFVEVPKDSEECRALYAAIEGHPEWQEQANWDQRQG